MKLELLLAVTSSEQRIAVEFKEGIICGHPLVLFKLLQPFAMLKPVDCIRVENGYLKVTVENE